MEGDVIPTSFKKVGLSSTSHYTLLNYIISWYVIQYALLSYAALYSK